MLVDGGLAYSPADPGSEARSVRAAADAGYDRLFVAETDHDPFLPVALAASAAVEHDLVLGTGIAVALARNPMTVAMTAHDLHALTGGRFVLGLGTQVKAHVTRRFSMPWSNPVARMREFVLAVRAIWSSWEAGTRVSFEGEFYRHTLSVPMFAPGPTGHGVPRLHLAAVGPRMAEVAGEVADGVMCHTFTSPSYVAEVTRPAVQRGRARSDRTGPVELSVPVLVATGPAGADLSAEVEKARRTVAFYGSTPAYRGVLEHHGWGDLHDELHHLSTSQRWDDMTALVEDGILAELVVVADATTLAAAVHQRWHGLLDAVRLNVPYDDDPATWAPVVRQFGQLATGDASWS